MQRLRPQFLALQDEPEAVVPGGDFGIQLHGTGDVFPGKVQVFQPEVGMTEFESDPGVG